LKFTDDEFITAWKRLGSPKAVAQALGLDIRGVYARRTKIEDRHGILLETITDNKGGRPKVLVPKQGFRALSENVTGTVIIGSDLHAWPGDRSTAFAAMVQLVRDLNPSMVILNGDAVDGATISRHPALANATMPTIVDELASVKEHLAEIESAAPLGCPLVWPQGNHDQRFMARLAANASEYRGVTGFDLSDHFPSWELCMSIWINGTVVVKHRNAGGIHGAYNNVLKSGKTMVTGHTHRLQAIQYNDYNGLRWGVECGTLSSFGPETDKYLYAEDAPMNWSQGFVVLTFTSSGELLEPELCRVLRGVAYFRGQPVISRESGLRARSQKRA
jgi:hypothetical protein